MTIEQSPRRFSIALKIAIVSWLVTVRHPLALRGGHGA